MGERSFPNRTFPISVFDHARDRVPKARRPSLGGLVDALTRFRRLDVADKRYLPAWSPASFVGDTRRADAVTTLSCIVFDLDDGPLEAATAAWSDAFHVAHTTWSHRPDRPRWRLVVPLGRPVAADAWAWTWRWAASRTPGVDPTCKDASRIYFVPASPDGSGEARVHAGALLDAAAMVPPERARQATRWEPAKDDAEPADRRAHAHDLGARLAGVGADARAERVACPACGRPSVWFWIDPRRQSSAACHHKQTCGWTGPLRQLGRAS
jgi:hypothetical protein